MLALFAALIAPYFIDWSSYRTAFEAEASRIIGQPVKVRGDADARLLPFPSVTFSDVVVGEDGQPSMTVSRFSMGAELAPFLRGEVRIFDMRVASPRATVRILQDGTLDWALKRKPMTPGDLVVLEKVAIENASVVIIDEQNGRTHQIGDVNALLSAKSLSGPWLIEAEGEIAGRRGAVSVATGIAAPDGSIRLRLRVVPDDWPALLETEGDARIEDNKPLYDGLFTFTMLAEPVPPGAAPAKPLVVAKGDFSANNERLRIEEWRAEVGLSDDPYVVTGEATVDTGPHPGFELIAEGQQIDMDRLGGEDGGQSAAAAPLAERLAVLNRIIDRLPPPPMPGRISLSLPAVVAGDTTLRDIALDARPDGDGWRLGKFSASLPGRTVVEAAGRLVSGAAASFEGVLTVASTQPSGLANWLSGEVDPVIRRLGAAGFSARVNLSAALQRFEALEVAIGPAILKGRLERQARNGPDPSLSVELSGDRFDVDAIRALVLLAGAGSSAGGPLLDHNLAARIKADTLTIGDYQLGGVETSLLLRDRNLTVERFSFDDLAGASGTFSAQLSGSLAAPLGTLNGRIQAAEASGLFALAGRLGGSQPIIPRLAANAFAFDELATDISLDIAPGTGPELVLSGKAGGSALRLRASGTGLMPGSDGPRTITLEAENPEAYRLLEQAGFAVLPLEGEGPAALRLNATGGADGGDLSIDATLTSAGSVLSLDGIGRLPDDAPVTGLFSLGIETGDIEPYLIMFGQALPQAGAGLPFSMTASLGLSGARVSLAGIEGQAGGNGFSGELDFNPVAGGLSAAGAVRLQYADLAWLSELALGPDLGQADGATFSDEPFLPPLENRPELRIALEADALDLGRGGGAENFKAELTTARGQMALSKAEADWFGGRLTGDLSLSNSEGSVFLSGRVAVNGADVGGLDRAVSGAAALQGTADLSATLEGTGQSARDLVGSLAGGGELVVNDLLIPGLDPNAFPRILGAVDREGYEINPDAVAETVAQTMTGGELRADALRLPFTLTGGTMRFSTAQIEAGEATFSGESRVDLTGLRLEADWRLAFDPGVEAIAGGDPSVGFGLNGLIVDPARSIDAGQLANYLSMRAFERERRKVELLQAGVVEKQRLRREIALLNERAAQREAEARARAEAEEAARRAAEEARRLAEEEARLKAEEEAEKARAEAAREAERAQAAREAAAAEAAARFAAEDAARAVDAAQPAPEPTIERRQLPPVTNAPGGLPQLDFKDLPGVEDPIRSLIAPGG